MQKFLLAAASLALIPFLALSVDMRISSGFLKVPYADGSFSETDTTGHPVRHAYFILSEEQYDAYMASSSPSEAIYGDFIEGTLGEYTIVDETTTGRGFYFDLHDYFFYNEMFEDDMAFSDYYDYEEEYFMAAVVVYEDDISGNTYYIAVPFTGTTITEDEEIEYIGNVNDPTMKIVDVALNAGRWQVIGGEPLEIECKAFSYAVGTVLATYSISDYSRLSEIVEDGSLSVSVAADVARTQDARTLPARLVSSDEAASTFTIAFTPGDDWPHDTLFLFGVGE